MGGVSMEWKEVRLGEVADVQTGPFGSQLHKENYVNKGTPIVTVEHLGNKWFTSQNLPMVSDEDKLRLAKYCSQEGDVIFSRVGSVDRCSYVSKEYSGWLFSGRCLRVRPRSGINPEYLYYFLTNEGTKQYIRNIAVGATMPSINTKLLNEVPITIPSLDDQHRIASILSSLDRKIELNNKINADLEEMAQAIFKNWFVDFEPFKDGKFVDSELGMIPEGWKVGTLGDITKNKSAKVKERNDVKVLSPVTTGELVLSEEYFTKQVFSSSIAKYKIVNKGNFAYNPARVNIGSLGRNEFDFDGCVSPVYVVFSVLDGYENYFDLFRKTDFFKDSVASLAIGGVRQSLSYDDLSSIEVIIPSENAVEEFNNLYNQMKKTIKANKLENSRLSLLRDTLLPRLMSGELEVPE